ncbi:hypothetical protein ACQP10_27395 [Streptosporangium sandarakinum]|uniref:hypothetical protein n=1 Tax=Streptosporangium sandarakinum TaxID=1260955 RepID=UPI00369F0CFE
MKRSMIAVLVAICVGGGAVLVAPIAFLVLFYGCNADDDRLAASLATLSVLDAHPANATPLKGRGSSCDNDDRITTVGQTYRPSGPRAEVLSFYRDAAIRDGWTPPPEDDGEGVGCFTKTVGGREVELSVWFLDEMGEKYGDDYDVDVTSSLDGGGWC